MALGCSHYLMYFHAIYKSFKNSALYAAIRKYNDLLMSL
jgi:hypothetical protein